MPLSMLACFTSYMADNIFAKTHSQASLMMSYKTRVLLVWHEIHERINMFVLVKDKC